MRSAQRSILRNNVSARVNTCAPPYIYKRAGLRQLNMTLPYSSVVTARAYINYTRTLLLNNPKSLDLHLIVLNAAYALLILYYSIDDGLLFALLIISPRYLNSSTFFKGYPLHLNTVSILIYMAFVLVTFIYSPLDWQNFSNTVIIY